MAETAKIPDQFIRQGADEKFTFQHCTRASKTDPIVPVDITGCTFRAQFRPSVDSPEVIDELTTENGRIVILDAVTGKYALLFPAEITDQMTYFNKLMVTDLEMTYSNGDQDRLWRGRFKLDQSVTRT